jgi:hypothetical protein
VYTLIFFWTSEEIDGVFVHLVQCWQYFIHVDPLLCWGIFLLFLVSSGLHHEGMLDFVKSYFSAFIKKIIWKLSFILFMCCIMFIDICTLDYPCIWYKTNLSQYFYILKFCFQVLKVCACFYQINWSLIFCLYCVIICFL